VHEVIQLGAPFVMGQDGRSHRGEHDDETDRTRRPGALPGSDDANPGRGDAGELSQTYHVSRQVLSQAKAKVEQAAQAALEPQKPGRKARSEELLQIEALKEQQGKLEKELAQEKKRVEIAQAFWELERTLDQGASAGPPGKKRTGKNAAGVLAAARRNLREARVALGQRRGWPETVMAMLMGVGKQALRRWCQRRQRTEPPPKQGRPPVISPAVWDKIRRCYLDSHREWGPQTLALRAARQGLGSYSPSTAGEAIADLKLPKPKRPKPKRYEVTAAEVMWSEDGAGFRQQGKKHELLVLQDECARYKLNHRLVAGPAKADDVCAYLR